MDFERDDTMLEEISDLISIKRDTKYLYSHIYLSEKEKSKSDPKIAELQNWKSQGIYSKVENKNQPCVSNQ